MLDKNNEEGAPNGHIGWGHPLLYTVFAKMVSTII